MATITQTFSQDLQEPVVVRHCEGTVFSQDNLSTTVRVIVTDGGSAAAALSGSVMCNVIRADGATVSFAGSLAGNVASATLPQSAMFVPGPIAVMLQLISGSTKTTLLKAIFTADLSTTGTAVDPGHTVPDLAELLARIDEMETATAAAEQAAADANAKLAQLEGIVELGYPTNEGTGAVIGINGTINAPYSDIVIYGKSVQNGTPTPAAPVEIQTAGSGGTIPIVGAGRNLLPVIFASATNNSVTFTALSDGSVIANGTPTTATGLITATTPLLPAGQYVITGCPPGGSWGSVNTYRIRIGRENGTYINDEIGNGYTIDLESSQKLQLQINIGVGYAANNLVFRPMLRLASDTDATFAPYVGTTASLPTPNGLPGIKVSSGGNYTDASGQQWVCDTIDLGRRVYTKRIRTGIATSFTGRSATEGIYMYLLDVRDRGGAAPAMISIGVPTASYSDLYVDTGEVHAGFNTADPNTLNYMRITFPTDSRYDSLEKVNALISGGMMYAYILATPVETPLTEAQITALTSLRTYKGGSTIYTTDAVQPELAVEAYIDIPTYIQSILNQ